MLYYAVITISSIGYGDISPNSNYALPQFWGAFLSIYGITFYALSIGYVSNIASLGITEKKEDEEYDLKRILRTYQENTIDATRACI